MRELKMLRHIAGVSQLRLAARTGVSRTKLSLVESHDVELSGEEERKVRKFLLKELQHQAAAIEYALAQEQQQEVRV